VGVPDEPDWFFLDGRERLLVSEALAVVRAARPEQAEGLDANLHRLARTADLVRDTPSIASWDTHGRSSSGESLLELLCRVPDWDLDLHLPTKAVLGQAYLVAKINFFKALGYALEALDAPALEDAVLAEVGQSIYSKLAEELFVSIVTDPEGSREVKVKAAESLFRIWEERLDTEIDDFAPVLESIWEARDKLRPVLGTMRGTQEFFKLLRESRDSRFLEYFSGDIPEVELQAFEEFLFGISHEEITRLREYVCEDASGVVSAEQARGLLGRSKESWAPAGGPQALYTSYKRRRVKAHYRELTDAPGPKKTAEEYLMTAFYSKTGRPSSIP
jgi:hypothetical protein